MIRYTCCPVCGSAHIQKVLSATDRTVSGESFEIWQCAGCSLRFTQDAPREADAGRYYQSDNYVSHSETRKGLVNYAYHEVRKLTLGVKRRLVVQVTGMERGRLLDVGAGTGAFLNHMQKTGWQVEGVEPDEGAVRTAATRYGLQLDPLDRLYTFGPGSFDVVTLWHVLEHVHRLHDTIEQLKKICGPDGKLVIAVPNYTSDDAQRYGQYWAAYDVPRHLYHFSPASMQVLVQKHGCRIERIYPMWFDSFYVSLLSEQYRRSTFPFFRGIWAGVRSNLKALSNERKASSLIYIISPADHFSRDQR